MPRHFLVKRHKHCGGTFSHRDRMPGGRDQSVYSSTTIIDTDKHLIIRDGDNISDYSGYSSPDSGYAASPNSSNIGFGREKDNLVIDVENNNDENFLKATAVISYYNNYKNNMATQSINAFNNCSNNNGDNDHFNLEAFDAPMDLSMSSKKRTTEHSSCAHLQQEDFQEHQTKYQQQQQQIYLCKPSPNHPVTATAAVVYFDSINKLYLNNNTDRSSLCAMMPLSPPSSSHIPYKPSTPRHIPPQSSSFYHETIKSNAQLNLESVAHSDLLSRAQGRPLSAATLAGAISSSSVSPLLSSPPLPGAPPTFDSRIINGRVTPLQAPSPLHSPSRKRGMPDDHEDSASDHIPHELSRSMPILKKCENITETNSTPGSKRTTPQKSKTSAVPTKKSSFSSSAGKRLKAVRRLNFDIDTTSPVSGTIIKNAAEFYAEEGKVVYGDIEPSFNFVEVTPEARAELERIENKIGDYICQLCKEFYEDAFQLAQHRCSRIVHVEYRCPECEKVFNCPANLASHRRWHKPRVLNRTVSGGTGKNQSTNAKIAPKPDCNGNNMTEAVQGATNQTDTTSSVHSAGRNSNITINGHDNAIDDIAKQEPTTFTHSAFTSKNLSEENSLSMTEDTSKLHVLTNNAEGKENGFSLIVNVSHLPNTESEEEQTLKPTSFPVTSAKSHDSFNRPNSVIAINPLHTTSFTYGSSLTSEERSLVLQVLSCHSRRKNETTTISSTNTVMTPQVADSHSNAVNLSNKICDADSNEDNASPRAHNQTNSYQDTEESLNSKSFYSSPSSPPLDLTQVSEIHQQQQQKQPQQQHPTALSENHSIPHIECSVCGKQFQRQAYLRKHFLSQHGKPNIGGKADDILTSDNTQEDKCSIKKATIEYIDHRVSTICGVCGKTFNTESAKLKHEAITHGIQPHLACSTCGMTFTSKAALEKHSRYAHVTETFSCKYCTSTFHSSPGLTRHINKCHPTENRRVILLQLPESRTC